MWRGRKWIMPCVCLRQRYLSKTLGRWSQHHVLNTGHDSLIQWGWANPVWITTCSFFPFSTLQSNCYKILVSTGFWLALSHCFAIKPLPVSELQSSMPPKLEDLIPIVHLLMEDGEWTLYGIPSLEYLLPSCQHISLSSCTQTQTPTTTKTATRTLKTGWDKSWLEYCFYDQFP